MRRVHPFLADGPWIFGASADLLVFGGSAAAAVLIVAAASLSGTLYSPFPDWLWLFCILGVDVAHVWSTLFRTAFDPGELRRKPALYTVVPTVAYAGGVALYCVWGGPVFWRVLAYLAVIHFVRQQAGWLALYRSKTSTPRFDRHLDRVAIYTATVYPLLYWHAQLPRVFSWLIDGDFAALPRALARAVLWCEPLYWLVLAVFVLRQLQLWVRGEWHLGKVTLVLSTWLCWWLGIIALNSDLAFSVTNVLIHGVPYLALTYRYGRTTTTASPAGASRMLLAGGVASFLAFVCGLAFVEEALWSRLVFGDRSWLFGPPMAILESALAWVVPLLALPQLVHYILDGFIWRRGSYPVRPPADSTALRSVL